ncbi:MAG: ABC transporter ATP-binding protein [Actinobacteria bacterium]|nr:ABC transporter ATP-binding protein [Actinomycetota bacterium]
MSQPYLQVEDLRVAFPTPDGVVNAVNGVSFSVDKGQTLAIVGESGCGKSVTSMAIMGLHNSRVAQISGKVLVDDPAGQVDIVSASEATVRSLRGRAVSMIFQDPMSSLHPFYTVGNQVAEAYLIHHDVSKEEAFERAIALLERVGIPEARRRASNFPHEFSGGMRQRAMIAMALVNNPTLVIADEPTTALDVTVQAQIISLLKDLQSEFGMAIIIITHDLGVVADIADDVAVMYAGRIVEKSNVRDVFYKPQMPYSIGLLSSVPRVDGVREDRLRTIPGQPPSLISLPQGCSFRARCAHSSLVADGACATTLPDLVDAGNGHLVRCHLDAATRTRVSAEALKREGAHS